MPNEGGRYKFHGERQTEEDDDYEGENLTEPAIPKEGDDAEAVDIEAQDNTSISYAFFGKDVVGVADTFQDFTTCCLLPFPATAKIDFDKASSISGTILSWLELLYAFLAHPVTVEILQYRLVSNIVLTGSNTNGVGLIFSINIPEDTELSLAGVYIPDDALQESRESHLDSIVSHFNNINLNATSSDDHINAEIGIIEERLDTIGTII